MSKPLVSASVKATFILAALEAAVVCLYGVLLIGFGLRQGQGLPVSTLMLGGFFLAVGGGIFLSGRLVFRAKPSGRSLLLVWQLFILILGIQAVFAGQLLPGISGSVVAGATILLLFSTPLNDHLFPKT